MAILTNYAIQCVDCVSGKTGVFLFDIDHWKKTGKFKAISPIYNDLVEFFKSEHAKNRKSLYEERI